MASQKAIDRLYKNVCRATENDCTLPVLDKQDVEYWVSRLSPWQLDALNRRTAPVDFKKDGASWSALIAKVVRFNKDNEKFDAALDASLNMSLDNLTLKDNEEFITLKVLRDDSSFNDHIRWRYLWLASDPSDPNPMVKKVKVTAKVFPFSTTQHAENGFHGIYAPLTKFTIPQLNTHWIVNTVPILNILPHTPAIRELVRHLNSVQLWTSPHNIILKDLQLSKGPSPLETIHKYLQALGTDWNGVTNFALEHFRSKVGSLGTPREGSKVRIFMDLIGWNTPGHIEACQHPWFSCDAVALVILALALPAHKLSSLRDRPDNAPNPTFKAHLFKELLEAELTPSASLRKAFDYAKAAALGRWKRTTVMMVALVDTEDWRLPHYPDARAQFAKKRAREHLLLSHFFVLGVGPEGMRMWQSWKYLGPRLEQHISLGGAKVRGWKEAGEFVDMFEDLVTRDVGKMFSSVKNEQFRKLFGVDVFDILAHYPKVRCREVLPKFVPWVEIRMVEDVKAKDVVKFEWEVDETEVQHPNDAQVVKCRWS